MANKNLNDLFSAYEDDLRTNRSKKIAELNAMIPQPTDEEITKAVMSRIKDVLPLDSYVVIGRRFFRKCDQTMGIELTLHLPPEELDRSSDQIQTRHQISQDIDEVYEQKKEDLRKWKLEALRATVNKEPIPPFDTILPVDIPESAEAV